MQIEIPTDKNSLSQKYESIARKYKPKILKYSRAFSDGYWTGFDIWGMVVGQIAQSDYVQARADRSFFFRQFAKVKSVGYLADLYGIEVALGSRKTDRPTPRSLEETIIKGVGDTFGIAVNCLTAGYLSVAVNALKLIVKNPPEKVDPISMI